MATDPDVILQELKALLHHTAPGAERERLLEALHQLEQHAGLGADVQLLERLEQLSVRIAEFEKRRDAERHAHDLAPGQDHLAPMVGGDLGPT